MRHPRLLRPALVFLAAALLSGCAYPISRQLRQEARKDLTFPMVLKDPTAYAGAIVLWGGYIIQTVTLAGGSEIMVLQTPLDYLDMPEEPISSQGRFIAKSANFLDPEIYKNGRKITLAGGIMGKESRPLDQSQYTYPVVAIKELYLWQKTKPYVYPYPYNDWYYGPGWRWGWEWYGLGPYWPYWVDWDEAEED